MRINGPPTPFRSNMGFVRHRVENSRTIVSFSIRGIVCKPCDEAKTFVTRTTHYSFSFENFDLTPECRMKQHAYDT